MSEEEVVITEKELDALKNDVLKENIEEISTQLGDPGRYFASFKAKDILDQSDCETIKAQITSIEKANAFIDAISDRKGRKGEHPYDVFVGALKRMKVHIHVVRILNQALARKRAELKTVKRADLPIITETSSTHHHTLPINTANAPIVPNGFPSNGSIINKGILPVANNSTKMTPSTTTTSSPTSSSSSATSSTSSFSTASTPPSHMTSPRVEMDRSLASSRSSCVSAEFPRVPHGYYGHGELTGVPEMTSKYVTEETSESSSLTVTTTTDDVTTTTDGDAHEFPSLPFGYNSDGSRQESEVTKLIEQSPDETLRPDIGPLPPPLPPQSSYNNHTPTQVNEDEHFIHQLQERVVFLENENKHLKILLDTQHSDLINNLKALEEEFKLVVQERDKFQLEKDVLSQERDRTLAINRHLESQIAVYRQGGNGRSKSSTTPMTTSGRLLSPNYHSPGGGGASKLETRRVTDPYLLKDNRFGQLHHRPSEPIGLGKFNHYPTARPNNLPLGIMANGSPQITPSYQDTPFPPDYRRPPHTRQSPGSDSSQDGIGQHYYKVSHSADDLTSGGEDQSSVRSFGSNHSGGKTNFELSSASNTRSTVV